MKKPKDSETAHSPIYAAARQEYNEQVGGLVTQRDNWRLTAFGALAVAFVSVGGMTWVGTRPPLPPYIVKVDTLGSPPIVFARADVMAPADPRVVAGQLHEWIANIRSVSPDVYAERRMLDRGYAIVSEHEQSFVYLNQWFIANDPWKRAETETIEVQPRDVAPPPKGDAWEINWTEYHRNRSGGIISTEDWHATVIVSTNRTIDGSMNPKNPTGLYIDNIGWHKLTSSGGAL